MKSWNLAVAATLFLTSCTTWRTMPEFDSFSLTPKELTEELGTPDKIIKDSENNKMGRVDEYRYYFVDRSEQVYCAQYWFRDGKWVSNSVIDPGFGPPREYRRPNMRTERDRQLVARFEGTQT